jgi:hypothetical protein
MFLSEGGWFGFLFDDWHLFLRGWSHIGGRVGVAGEAGHAREVVLLGRLCYLRFGGLDLFAG